MINIIAKIIELLEKSQLSDLLDGDFQDNRWVWLNKDTYQDLVLNVMDYSLEEELEVFSAIKGIKDSVIIDIVRAKMKDIGWIEVNQRIFQELESGFKPTSDIETYVFVEKKHYMSMMISKLKELQWILKAMAVDYYQHISPEGSSLQRIYDEFFNNNDMIIEELLLTGEYRKTPALWKFNKKTNSIYFCKSGKIHRQWAEGNASFVFYELNK